MSAQSSAWNVSGWVPSFVSSSRRPPVVTVQPTPKRGRFIPVLAVMPPSTGSATPLT